MVREVVTAEKPVYVTKYVLSQGILVFTKGEIGSTMGSKQRYFTVAAGYGSLWVLEREWTHDRAVALEQFAAAKAARIKSLKKSLIDVEKAEPKFVDKP